MKVQRQAFTLVEILVALAILAILGVVTVLIINPAQRLSDADQAKITQDMTVAADALQLYLVDNLGRTPPRDGGGSSQVETRNWVQTQNIDLNTCGGDYQLSQYDDAISGTYIPYDIMEEIEHSYRVVFINTGGFFICREDSDPLDYIIK